MKTMPLLAILSLFTLSAPAVASLRTPTALAVAAPSLPRNIPVALGGCEERFDAFLLELQKPNYNHDSQTTVTVLLPKLAYTNVFDSAERNGNELVGTAPMRPHDGGADEPLSYRFLKVEGKIKLRWTFRGQTQIAAIDSCHHDFWTATSPASAIALHLAKPTPAPS
jgi:hypothetical protein